MNAERNPTFSMIGSENLAAQSATLPDGGVADRAALAAEQPHSPKPMHPRIRAAVARLGLTQRESQIVEKFAGGMSTQALDSRLIAGVRPRAS